jgi:hypothetical protein
MLLVRIIGLLIVAAIGVSVLVYVVSGNRRYLRFAWTIFKYGLFVAVLLLSAILAERLLVAV